MISYLVLLHERDASLDDPRHRFSGNRFHGTIPGMPLLDHRGDPFLFSRVANRYVIDQ